MIFNTRLPKAASTFLLACTLIFTQLSGLAQVQFGGEKPEAPPYQWPRSHDYDVQHYRIAVSFDWAKKSVAGETTITLRPLKNNFGEVELDAGDMTINSVALAQGKTLTFRYENNEKLLVALDKPYPAGADVAIKINYAATPRRGLTFIVPTDADPTRPHQIWSQGETQTNHYWFPCYDYPNDKATTEMVATVEYKYQVISNGQLLNVAPNAAKKTKTWHWKMSQPFSSYLVSIIVGEYVEVKGQFKSTPVISYVYPNQVEDGRLSHGKLPQMVAFFSEKIGYDYPYAKYVQTMVRDFGGAMENITATTMTDTSVHDKRAHLDVSSDGIASHELAHQWFGDLLTCRDWGEIWLNESFATFFAALWTEHDKGRDAYLYEMMGNQQAYFQAWMSGMRRPIVTNRYSDPDAVFDVYAYPRGGAVLNMLRFVLGEEMFWKAINRYVRKYEWQNVETAQLNIAIEEATGQNLEWFFDEWLYKMGHPEFEITQDYDGASTLRLKVKQTQKPDDKRPWFHSPDFFAMPVDIAITTATGEKVHRVTIDKPEKEFTFAVDSKPLIVNFDRGNYLIKQVKFNRGDSDLAHQLLHDTDVTGRLRAAMELRTSRSESATKGLTEAAVRDPFWGVRVEAVKSLAEFRNDASRAALLEAVKDKESRVRREAIKALAAFRDPKLAGLFINIINTDQSYFAVSEAATALGRTGAPEAYDVLVATLKQDSWQDTILAGAMSGLAALKDARALDIALKHAAPGNRATVRASAFNMLGEIGKGNDRALEILTSALKEESLQTVFAALQAVGSLGDARAIPALEELAKKPPAGVPEGMARQFIGGVINRLKNAAKQGEKKN
ncbi:MAG TPA: M1 family aminopeptidase [Blastocatellia bacterium]|nr:M1 family aminopeptidase [Blastocatellia bacterium]